MLSTYKRIVSAGLSLLSTGQWVRGMGESEGMDRKERESIIPLKRLANTIGTSIFDGNDRDAAVDKETASEKYMPSTIQFISFKGSKND